MNILQAKAQTASFYRNRKEAELARVLKEINFQSKNGKSTCQIRDLWDSAHEALLALGYKVNVDNHNIGYISW